MNAILFRIFCFVWLVSFASWAFAEEEHEADRAYLLQTLAKVEAALNNKDINALLPMLDAQVVAIFQNAEVTRGTAAVQAYYDKMLGKTDAILTSYTTKASVDHPARFYGEIALADGHSEDTIVFVNGSEIIMHTVWSVALQKQGDDWKVVQLHFSTNVFDNPLLDTAKKNLWIAAAVAGFLAFIVGLLLGRRRKRHG